MPDVVQRLGPIFFWATLTRKEVTFKEVKMEALTLLLLFSVSGFSHILQARQTDVLRNNGQSDFRRQQLRYFSTPEAVRGNTEQRMRAESSEISQTETQETNSTGRSVKDDKSEEERRSLTSQTEPERQKIVENLDEEEKELKLALRARRRNRNKRGKSVKGTRKVKSIKITNHDELLKRQKKDHPVANHTPPLASTSTHAGKESTTQSITQPQSPPPPPLHNGPLSTPITPSQVAPNSSHLPTPLTRVSSQFFPPAANIPTYLDHMSNQTLNQENVPTAEATRKIKTVSRQNKAGFTPKPREDESNLTPLHPAHKPNTLTPTGKHKKVKLTKNDIKLKENEASSPRPQLSKPSAKSNHTTAPKPSTKPAQINRGSKNKTTRKSKEKESNKGNTSQTTAAKEKETKLPMPADYCPPACLCYGSVVQCSDKSVDKVPYGIPHDARYILLMNNNIMGIQRNFFHKYLSVEVLALTNNWLTDGAIKGAFGGIKSLKHLYLDGNLLESVPTNLPVSLEELRLDNNYLRVLTEAAWSQCPGLFVLRLSNNSLGHGPDSFPDAVFSSLNNLHTLNLDHNQLTSIPLRLPLVLKELYLKGNLIERVFKEAFDGMSQLEVLDLSKNRLTNEGIRHSLNGTSLESLNLEGNRLEHVPLHLPATLTSLNLEGNLISSIKKADFSRMKRLELLGLARNRIFEVAPGAFRDLRVLHRLDLCHNTLDQVPRQLPRRLHSVALTHNKIQAVPQDAFCWGNKSLSLRGFVEVHLEQNLIDVGRLDPWAFRCLKGFQLVHSY